MGATGSAGSGSADAVRATSQRNTRSAGPRVAPMTSETTHPIPMTAHTPSAISPATAAPTDLTPTRPSVRKTATKTSVCER